MGGNLISLTIGGWCYEQVGVMNGLTLSVPEESPWEIAIPDAGNTSVVEGTDILNDPSVKEMPMIVKVTGFSFKPIHNFVPQVQDNDYTTNFQEGSKFVSKYGDERYIALSNEGANVNNYKGGSKNLNYLPPSVKSDKT